MRERPIIFTGEMVRAILEGRKSVTRRIIKPQPVMHDFGRGAEPAFLPPQTIKGYQAIGVYAVNNGSPGLVKNPYGQAGDRLWVRETVCDNGGGEYEYKATSYSQAGSWSSPIHMPRRASRLTLEITGVRVERLREITEEDAKAEGVEPAKWTNANQTCTLTCTPRATFSTLWDQINGKRASWESNPWVWVIDFRRVKA